MHEHHALDETDTDYHKPHHNIQFDDDDVEAQSDEEEKALHRDVESGAKPKKVWYVNMKAKLNTDTWYLFLASIIIDCAAVIYFVTMDAYHQNYFATVYMQLFVFQQGCLGIYFIKELWIESRGKDHEYIKHLQSHTNAYALTNLTPEELTELAIKSHEICDVGDNIYS